MHKLLALVMSTKPRMRFWQKAGGCVAGDSLSISVTCACGEKLKAPATAIGTKGKCPGCGATLALVAGEHEPEPAAMAVPDTLRSASVPPPVPQAVLRYQTPRGYVATSAMWREGHLAVSQCNEPFAMRCVKCNTPLEPKLMKRATLYWQHPAYYFTLLAGLLIGAIVLLCVRQKTDTAFGLCKVHRGKRRNRVLIGWLIGLAGLGLWVLSIFFMSPGPWKNYRLTPICFFVGLVCVLGSLIWAVAAVPTIGVKRMRNNLVWYSGTGEQFLGGLAAI